MCRNGQYTERGIKQIDGFMSERWRIEPEYVMKVDPSLGLLGVLLEPTTVVAKAWEQVSVLGSRAFWEPRQVLVTGAGPIGLLAALLGVQRGLDVHVLDQVTEGAKPQLVADLGATYHSGSVKDVGFEPDVIIECTGVGQVVVDSMTQIGAGGVLCLTGVGQRRPDPEGCSAADVATELVLQNNVIVGSVNANKRHFYKAAQALAAADRDWLGRAGLPAGGPRRHRRRPDPRPGRHQGRRGLRGRRVVTEAVACTTEQTQLGEGTRWDARRDELLRVDILAGRVYRDRVADDGSLVPVRTYDVPGTVGALAPMDGDDGWVLAAGQQFVHLAEDGALTPMADVVGVGQPAQRRRVRPAGPALGRDARRRPPRRRRRALPAGRRRPGRAGARRADHPERHGVEPRRHDDVPDRQRSADDHGVRLRPGGAARSPAGGCSSRCPTGRARPTG